MDNEDLLTIFINRVCDLDKAAMRMRAKYVWDTRPGTIQEKFESDARDWAMWKKIGVR